MDDSGLCTYGFNEEVRLVLSRSIARQAGREAAGHLASCAQPCSPESSRKLFALPAWTQPTPAE